MDEQSLDVEIRHANGDTNYKSCNRQHLVEPPFAPFLTIVASNKKNLNDIDIDAIFVKNMDPRVYTDPKVLEEERLQFLVQRHSQIADDGNVHAHDLISMRIQDRIKTDQRKSLAMIDGDDDQFEIMFKYYETIKNYQQNLGDLHNTIKMFNDDQIFAQKIVMKAAQGEQLNEELEIVKKKTASLNTEFDKMRDLIVQIQRDSNVDGGSSSSQSSEQRKRSSSSGNNDYEDPELAKIRFDSSIENAVRQLHAKVDVILTKVKDASAEVEKFSSNFPN